MVIRALPLAGQPHASAAQEHVALLRELALAFPAAFPDAHHLTDADPELDFWNNVAHLQLHRRSRALQRLQRVRPPVPCQLRCAPSLASSGMQAT